MRPLAARNPDWYFPPQTPSSPASMKLGILADTHDELDPRIATVFAGVDRIVHAGDVCGPHLITELERLAPVTVVLGNNDAHFHWNDSETFELGGCRFLVEHIVSPEQPTRSLRERLRRIQPNVVIFGHTHRPYCQRLDGILFLNPGSAGSPRYGLPRSVCLVDVNRGMVEPRFVDLP